MIPLTERQLVAQELRGNIHAGQEQAARPLSH